MKLAPPTDPAAAASTVTLTGSAPGRPGGSDAGTPRVAGNSSAGGQSATVRLSAAAANLQAVASTPEFNAEKVQALRKAIEDGSFQVNAGVIADRLIGNARELLKHVSH